SPGVGRTADTAPGATGTDHDPAGAGADGAAATEGGASGRPDGAQTAGSDPARAAEDAVAAAAPDTDSGTGAPPPTDEVVERRLHPVTPLRRAWAPVAVLVG
ncbi:hypothetical protein WFJ45_24040, partial [Salmonella enterica subsp. enterica serovar Minnesota]